MKNTKTEKREKTNYEYDRLIYFYAETNTILTPFVKAVIEAESNFNPNDVSCTKA